MHPFLNSYLTSSIVCNHTSIHVHIFWTLVAVRTWKEVVTTTPIARPSAPIHAVAGPKICEKVLILKIFELNCFPLLVYSRAPVYFYQILGILGMQFHKKILGSNK